MRHAAYMSALVLLAACAKDGVANGEPAHNDPSADDPVSASDCPVIRSDNWSAWIDAEPPGPARLHIRGEAVLPTPGYRASWRVGAADRMMPPGQHMHLSFSAPDGIVSQVVTTEEIAYAGKAVYPEYRAIYIHCGDQLLGEITEIPTAR